MQYALTDERGMAHMGRLATGVMFLICGAIAAWADDADRKAEYVHAVVRGAGLMPWQSEGVSKEETAFRASIEERKAAMIQGRTAVQHPALIDPAAMAHAKANIESWDWAKSWLDNQVEMADYVAAQPESWVEAMIPALSPAHGYGFTCPVCVGEKSQEAVGDSLAAWSYRDPDKLTCRACGQVFPDPAFPETAVLKMPRMGQEITYYRNAEEQANPDDYSGGLAWHWVGYPMHVSFTGIIRENKIAFMRTAARASALAYAFTGDVRYAERARAILLRFADCYRNWLYHDYWDTYADCDPLYAAWHDKALPLEWKRHLSEQAYAKDTVDKAAMLQNYWGAGRMHPSTDGISGVDFFALAYDLTVDAKRADGSALWTADDRHKVESDFLLEYVMGAEPYIGGPGEANNKNNKSPRIYNAMASVAMVLGLPEYADVALKGYETVRDNSFAFDGFSTESPSYNNMYLGQLLVVPETLHGFQWPANFPGRSGTVNYYESDPMLRLMYRAVLWTLTPGGDYLPLSDTHVHSGPSQHIALMGLKRYPDLYEGVMPSLYKGGGGEYALYNFSQADLAKDTGLNPPETLFPAWRTAVLRHSAGDAGSVLTLAFNLEGGHRHRDNLALFYEDHGGTMAGDLGYVGDMPINDWIRSTYSHNLVIVNDEEQAFGDRQPAFQFMATSPLVSVVEASTNAYDECTDYRRRVALIKESDGNTFAVDLFRVAGGRKHAFRAYSECAASDAPNGTIAFDGLTLPAEAPLPQVGSSLDRADIFGLRDVRSAKPEANTWSATWRDDNRAYRLLMASPVDRVEASNGPGQRSLDEAGRRVRYVDAVREGENLTSAFVAVHDPGRSDGFTVHAVEILDATAGGPDALALQITTATGAYLVLHDFTEEAEVHGVRFKGSFACLLEKDGAWVSVLSVGAARLSAGAMDVQRPAGVFEAAIAATGATGFAMAQPLPENWVAPQDDVRAYARVKMDEGWTGLPVAALTGDRVEVADYPMPPATACELFAVDYWTAFP